VEKRKINFVLRAMPVMELFLMAKQLKSTSACFVTDETQ